LFVFFFVSGFCSLVYQVIWTRLAFASFGIIIRVLSVVISGEGAVLLFAQSEIGLGFSAAPAKINANGSR
jgi:hypothetical protein